MNSDLATTGAYCYLWKLRLNAKKTTYSVFTRSNKKARETQNLRMHGEKIEKQDSSSYLGIALDQQFNFSRFISILKEKATKRFNLVKRLASRPMSWGANKPTLRHLYLGYVRSIVDYVYSLQTVASKTVSTSLDKVQNQAFRLICVGLRSTPETACEIDAKSNPLTSAVRDPHWKLLSGTEDSTHTIQIDNLWRSGRTQQDSNKSPLIKQHRPSVPSTSYLKTGNSL